jgi:hypothetical protein
MVWACVYVAVWVSLIPLCKSLFSPDIAQIAINQGHFIYQPFVTNNFQKMYILGVPANKI